MKFFKQNPLWWLTWYVFLIGFVTMVLEMAAFRMYTPVFGGSIIVWGSIIGVVMAGLAGGYWIGGRVSKGARPGTWLFGFGLVAAGYMVAIPLLLESILPPLATGLFATQTVSLILGSLIAAVMMFIVPMICLGGITPLAIGLLTKRLDEAGDKAARVYAMSTTGSIFGTFAATFVFLPFFGTNETILIAATVCLLVSISGFIRGIRVK